MNKYMRGLLSSIVILSLKLKNRRKFNSKWIQDISSSTTIEIRKNSRIVLEGLIHTKKNVELKAFQGGQLIIGRRCTFNNNCMIASGNNIVIGEGTIFGPNVVVVDHDHDFRNVNSILNAQYVFKEVKIGKNVWIGANVVILKGTIIGDNSVIGAGCIVSGRIDENTIVTQKKELKLVTIS